MIGSLEQSLVDRVAFLNKNDVLGYSLKTVKSYGGEVNGAPREFLKHFPAVWFVYDGSTVLQSGSDFVKFRSKYMCLIGAKSLRNEAAARHGAGEDVGAYQMLADMVGILHKFTPGVEGASAFDVGRIVPLYADRSDKSMAAVYAIELSIAHSVSGTDLESAAASPLSIIHTNWDLPPHGNVGPQIPDDENADWTDHQTLET